MNNKGNFISKDPELKETNKKYFKKDNQIKNNIHIETNMNLKNN